MYLLSARMWRRNQPLTFTEEFSMHNSHLLSVSRSFYISLVLLLTLFVVPVPVQAQANVIVVSTTVQAAVDAANPGDIIRVPPGLYQENVIVTKNNITIKGQSGAILDGSGLTGNSGITVRPSSPSARISG